MIKSVRRADEHENLGMFGACVFVYLSSLFTICVILLCYIIAVYNGHVPLFLPMISDCGVYAPERYIFTIGLVLAAVFLFINSMFLYFFLSTITLGGRRDSDRVALVFSFISAAALSLLAAANELDGPEVHDAAAFTFFGFHLAFMIVTTIRLFCDSNSCRYISEHSLIIKTVIIILATIDTVICGVLIFKDSERTFIAITEWIAVFFISCLRLVLSLNSNIMSILACCI